jgi:hypothetical protein
MVTIPYTYLIGWSNHNLWYYGVRYSKGCNPDDLWSKYFTSSKYVAEIRSSIGEPDVIQIRKTFTNSKDAQVWETKVLRRMHVLTDQRWINKSIAGVFVIDDDVRAKMSASRRGRKFSDSHKLAMSISHKGVLLSEDHKAKQTAGKIGMIRQPHTQEAKMKMSLAHKGRKLSPEHRANMSAARLGKKRGPYSRRKGDISSPKPTSSNL